MVFVKKTDLEYFKIKVINNNPGVYECNPDLNAL